MERGASNPGRQGVRYRCAQPQGVTGEENKGSEGPTVQGLETCVAGGAAGREKPSGQTNPTQRKPNAAMRYGAAMPRLAYGKVNLSAEGCLLPTAYWLLLIEC